MKQILHLRDPAHNTSARWGADNHVPPVIVGQAVEVVIRREFRRHLT